MKEMPHNFDAEKSILGAILYDNAVADGAVEILNSDGSDFYHKAHQVIFKTMISLVNCGGVADFVTITNDLQSAGLLGKVGGPAYITELTDGMFSAANARHYAQIVKDKANERRIIEAAQCMIDSVYAGQSEEAIAEAQKSILALSMESGKNTIRLADHIARKTLEQIETRYKKGGGSVTGTAVGLQDYDAITGGLQIGDLIIIAGRPGMGKSALGGHIAKHAALNGTPTIIFSLEMPAESIMTRFFADMTGIDSRQLRRGFIHNSQWGKLVNAVSRIGTAPLFIDDKPDITPTEIRAKARRLKAEHNLGLLIVDYIQLVRVPGKHDTREQVVAEISRTLKAIARELSIPVIGLSQLNRQVDTRSDKRPMLSDLRESGAIEQDADLIAFIYRDKRPDNPGSGIAQIEIAKHRNGPTGLIKLWFDETTQTFRDVHGDGQ